MNTSLSDWCRRIGNRRFWPDDRSLRVEQVWAKERPLLISLPKGRQEPKEQESLRSGKTPWVNFDLNYYSIPPDYLGRPLFLQASWERVEIFSDATLIATHNRSFDKGSYIDDPKHRDELVKHKYFGRANMFRDAITKEFPETNHFIDVLFDQGWEIHTVVRRLHLLRHEFGRDIFDLALKAAIKNDRVSLDGLRIQAQKLQQEQNLPPPVPLELPDNPKIKNLSVISHPLKNYDKL